jgi:hypothetical protein
MTSLRLRMMEDMQVRNLSRHTQDSYLRQVSQFARHFAKSPDLLGPEDIHAYQVYLTNEKKLAPRSVQVTVAALRFLYRVTLGLDWDFERIIPCPKAPKTLAVILSPEEVLHFLGCIESFKHQAILTTCYAAGLRISEATRLKPEAIDRQRMVLRVEQGKGQKDRYVMLSARLLEALTAYWRAVRPTGGMDVSRRRCWRADIDKGRRCRLPPGTSDVETLQAGNTSFPAIPCGTHLRCTYSKLEPIFAPSSSCSAIAACQRPLSICGSLPPRSAQRRARLNCCGVRSPRLLRHQRLNISDGQPRGPLRSGGRGYIPSLRCCLARAALGLAIDRTTRSYDCYRALPNFGARRPCRTVRPLWRTTDRVQQLPFPQLPQVPVTRPSKNGSRLSGKSFSIRSISMSSSPFPTRSPRLPSRMPARSTRSCSTRPPRRCAPSLPIGDISARRSGFSRCFTLGVRISARTLTQDTGHYHLLDFQ